MAVVIIADVIRRLVGQPSGSIRGPTGHRKVVVGVTVPVNIAVEFFDRCRTSARAWPKRIAEQLALLVWSTDDNGSEIMTAIERWLQSDDIDRVRVAVEGLGVFPFRHRGEMDAVLALVKARWPDLAEKCDRLVAARAALPQEPAPPLDVQQRVKQLEEMLRQI